MNPSLSPGRWFVHYSINVNEELSRRTPNARFRDEVRALVSSAGVTVDSCDARRVDVGWGTGRYLVTCSVEFTVPSNTERRFSGALLNAAVAAAFKRSSGDLTLSETRIRDALNADRDISEVLSLHPAIAQCSADYRSLPAGVTAPSTGVTSAAGSTVAASRAVVVDSTRPQEIGQAPPPLNGSVLDSISGLWNAVPLPYKVAGVVAASVLTVVVVGYTVRAVKA